VVAHAGWLGVEHFVGGDWRELVAAFQCVQALPVLPQQLPSH